MKGGLGDIVGKEIAGVIVARNDRRAPKHQLFLLFTDGTRYEIYGEHFTCCGGVDEASGVLRAIEAGGAQVTRLYGTPELVPVPQEPLEQLMKRDLRAWETARAAIEKARGTSF